MAVDIDQIVTDTKTYYTELMEQKGRYTGEQLYTDLNDWLAQSYPVEDLGKLEMKLKDLYKRACDVNGVEAESRFGVYPEYATGVTSLKLHLWHLGFSAESFIRGSTAAYNVITVMEKNLRDGGNTERFPIEVVPFFTGKEPGQGVSAFDIVTSIGASVVTSAYLICLWIIEQGYFNGPFDDAEKARLSPLASIVLSIMNINAVYEPFKDVKDAVFKSNKGKIEASQRPRPTILSYYYSYSRVATDILHQKKSRKTRTELVMDQVQQHNVQEKVRASKIKTVDIAALKNLLGMSDWFTRRLKIIYQYQSPVYTSVPTQLLASSFLSTSTEPSVNKEENPVWYNIEGFSQEKADAWLARTDGRFNFKVQEVISKGKKPSLLNMAASYRDTNNEHQVWLMACLKVWAWPEAVKRNSEQRLEELEQAWRRGALDETLRVHVISKRKDFNASDLAWVGAQSHGVEAFGALADVDPLGQQQQQLTDVQRKYISCQFEEWAQRLNIEASKHKLWLTEVEAFDSKSESELQRFRNERALTKKLAVETLCDTHYACQGFTAKDKAFSFLASSLVKAADVQPTRAAASVLRLIWADMAQLGLGHSRHTDDIIDYIKMQCESHPDVTAGLLCMPNTP